MTVLSSFGVRCSTLGVRGFRICTQNASSGASLLVLRACRSKNSDEKEMSRQINGEREQEHEKNHKHRPGQNPLWIVPETINPIHIFLRVAHQIRDRKDHQRHNCLPNKRALIVAKSVKRPEK